ncbi:von Willebrand factor type A domain containing protein [Aphelenchoides avenae]|nr:von Willebrand factor type A domain containing protein [Aphelenchus avenae]
MAQLLRERISNLQIWAYGTGEYVAMSSLTDITQDPSKIVTNKNLSLLETQFEPWKGTEVCDKMPVCIRGSDKPLDLVLVIDSSDSVAEVFPQQVEFALERIVRHINVHPDAVR